MKKVSAGNVNCQFRHGKSKLIRIGLHKMHPWLRLTVEDNCKGFDLIKSNDAIEKSRIGLDSMQRRVESTGGIYSIVSAPGKGTTVKAEWRIG